MDPQSLTILVGAFQRILSILIGGMLAISVIACFSAYQANPDTAVAAESFSLGRGSKVKLSKVGPGVFFAIFGAGLIAYSFAKPMKVNIPTTAPTAPNAASASKADTTTIAAAGFSYIRAVSAPETEEDRAPVRDLIS
jgi:hypothetical protein